MAKALQRKKPGYTKGGEVKIVSLNYQQLADMLVKTGKNKIKGKIQSRMRALERRKDFVKPIAVEAVSE